MPFLSPKLTSASLLISSSAKSSTDNLTASIRGVLPSSVWAFTFVARCLNSTWIGKLLHYSTSIGMSFFFLTIKTPLASAATAACNGVLPLQS